MVADHVLDLAERPVGRLGQVDRRLAAGRGGHPGCGQEIGPGADQVLGPGADPLRVGKHDMGAGGQQLGQQGQPARHQHRDQRLHALDGDAGGELAEHLGQRRVAGALGRQVGGPVPDLLGQQDLAAGLGRDRLDRVDGSLVGDGERAHVGDLVAEELDPDRVVVGRREDVQNAAADGDLAALLDHLDAGVGQHDEPVDKLAEVGPVPHSQLDGRQLAEIRRHRLDQRPDGGHHDLRCAGRVTLGMGQPSQGGQSLADGVGSRRKSFVRQRFPGREDHHLVVADQVTDRGSGYFGLAAGRRHQQDGNPGAAAFLADGQR